MKRFILLFSLFIITLLPTIALAQEKLIFAVDIIRHGDRNPIEDFPADPFPWPQGLGALTPLGMQQEYQLGISFRKLYIDKYHLLPAHYDIKTMQVHSDTSNRTIQSAESLLYGLYPLGTGPKISNQFAVPAGYQPIPIFTDIKYGRAGITAQAMTTLEKLS